MAIECRAVCPEDLSDWLSFIEGGAFIDNPHWASCYCVFHYLADAADGPWAERSGQVNRECLSTMVCEGRGRWILARDETRIVGWVNADLRPALRRYDEWGAPTDATMGVVACFVVDPVRRRQGIAGLLLEAACRDLGERGAREIHAWVIQDPAGATASDTVGLGTDQMAHHGPLAMYLNAGFEVVDEADGLAHVRRATDI